MWNVPPVYTTRPQLDHLPVKLVKEGGAVIALIEDALAPYGMVWVFPKCVPTKMPISLTVIIKKILREKKNTTLSISIHCL